MMTRAYVLHALSPLHAGTGQAADLIDLPIARLKGTNIPFVPGSSVKGVLRDGARADAEAQKMTEDELLSVFGPDTENAADHAGALVCSDARLLALPVRSFRGTFAYATSPLLLHLAKRDLGTDLPVPDLGAERVALTPGSALRETADPKVYFEDLDLFVEDEAAAAAEEWAQFLRPRSARCSQSASQSWMTPR
jgi:CRISPR-associated protein Cmr4